MPSLQRTANVIGNALRRATLLPSSNEYESAVRALSVNSFGVMGSSLLLEELGLAPLSLSFVQRAADVLTSGNPEALLATSPLLFNDTASLGDACSFAEYFVTLSSTGSDDESPVQLEGSLLRKNGFGDRILLPVTNLSVTAPFTQRREQPLFAVRFARNRIDRRACSEFRLLSQLAALNPKRSSGHVRLFISRAPCISCISAMVQFQRLCPSIELKVGFPSSTRRSAAT